MLSAEFSSTVYVTSDQKSVWRRFHKYLLCVNLLVLGTYCTLPENVWQKTSVALMCKAVECTLNSATVPKHLLKFFRWCNFHLCMSFSSCKISFLIIVFTQNILASTVHTFVGFGKTNQVSCVFS
jgi:hypothetical protein